MTDITPSWQEDPTGRHDHRYWDGTQWTEHVADAGVASVDPYEEAPAAAPEPAGEPEAVDAPVTFDQPAGLAEPEVPAQEAAPTEPESPTVGLSTGWGAAPATDEPATAAAAPAAAGVETLDEDELAEDAGAAATDEPARTAVSGWGVATEATEVTPGLEPDAPTDVTAAWPATPAATAWTTAASEPTTVVTATEAPGGPDEPPAGSRKGPLLLALGLLAVVGLVVAILALRGDGESNSPEAIASRIADAVQDGEGALADISDEDARCIGDHIVDEIGTERLEGIDFAQDRTPAELEEDLASALTSAVNACDISTDGGTTIDGDASSDEGDTDSSDVSTGTESDIDIANPDDLEALLIESFVTQYQLPRPKAECLAGALTDAIREGQTDPENLFGEPNAYQQFLDGCDISYSEVGLTDP